MPFYADNDRQVKLSRAERKRLAHEKAILIIEENRYLSRGKSSKIRHFILYPLCGLITSCTTLWWYYNFEEDTEYAKYYLIPLMIFTTLSLVASCINDENYFKPELERIREPAIALELSKKGKFANREARLEKLQEVKELTVGKEAAYYAIFINNAIFYAQVVLAYSYFLKSVPNQYGYIFSVMIAAFCKLSFLYEKYKTRR
ncbi:hypothetical protein O3M35_007623 [Rhynocoris fuscipes]|uniref:Signal sequence receptor subunit gamma n=1 Tax=Rhynocoris fuscipes TaxID=488301 RepID=A0AAW1DHB5_9HEMI